MSPDLNMKTNILIVEDNIDNLTILVNLFTTHGYQVYPALNGALALKAVLTTLPDIVLLDIMMPGLDGYAVCQRLKADERTREIPVLFISALNESVNKVKAFQVGGVDFITKPFQIEEVLARVETHLQLSHLQQRLQEQNARLQSEIQERTQAEAALQQSQAKLQAILDSTRQSFLLLDREACIQAFNQAAQGYAQQFFGNAIVEGAPIANYVPAKERANFSAHFHEALRGETQAVEKSFDDVNGQAWWLAFYLQPVMRADGQIAGVCLNLLNITERKRMEEALRQARDSAEAANRAKSAFLANMSHELRTPLTSILGYAQLLKRDQHATEFQHTSLHTIERSGNHLLTLINDILDLSKIEAQKMELHEVELHFPGFLKELDEIIRIRAQQKGLTYHCETNGNLPAVLRADEKLLRQVMLNLLSNAVKFTERGEVTLRVARVAREVGKDPQQPAASHRYAAIRFEVRDTGVGIPPDKLENIFVPFTRLDDYAGKKEGTGLGLAISRKLVHLLGGELQVASAVGQGSRFWFDAVFAEVAQPLAPKPASPQTVIGYAPIPPLTGSIKVLIIDDTGENRAILTNLLTPIGFEVLEAADGPAGLRKAAAFQPHLILLDLLMPGMDGFEVARRLRKLETGNAPFDYAQGDACSECRRTGHGERSRTTIIAVSADTLAVTRQKSLAAGCDDFLPKPFDFQEILATLQRHLALEWIYAASPAQPAATTETAPPLVLPALDELAALVKFAQLGNIMKIRQCAEEMLQRDPQLRPFAVKLKQFAQEYRIDYIRRWLTGLIQEQQLVLPASLRNDKDCG